jgi:hypothetical protein
MTVDAAVVACEALERGGWWYDLREPHRRVRR